MVCAFYNFTGTKSLHHKHIAVNLTIGFWLNAHDILFKMKYLVWK